VEPTHRVLPVIAAWKMVQTGNSKGDEELLLLERIAISSSVGLPGVSEEDYPRWVRVGVCSRNEACADFPRLLQPTHRASA
jgi:hypothetical protein